MNGAFCVRLIGIALVGWTSFSAADPTVGATTVLGPLAGPGATLHSGNTSPTIELVGTDLGWTYAHGDDLQFLFGDTHAAVSGLTASPIDPTHGPSPATYDDAYGTVDLSTYDDPGVFPSSGVSGFPLILFGQHASSVNAKAINPGHWLDGFKTPVAGWSNGSREYGIFYISKPEGCQYDSQCDDLVSDQTCDQGLAFWWEEYYDPKSFTGVCVDGTFGCLDDTMVNFFGWPIAGTGFCSDETSTVYDTSDVGRILSTGYKLLIGVRSTSDEREYTNTEAWLTNKFLNVATTTVQDFVPSDGAFDPISGNQDYNVASGSGSNRRVLLFGRPGFVGINANGRNLGLYFAYVDMPTSTAIDWTVHYYTGTSGGIPQFSTNESDAAPLDLSSQTSGKPASWEDQDVVQQMSIVWVDHLDKWVMFYGGGISTVPFVPFTGCGVLEYFAGADECGDVELDDGAIRMRTADDPWGPWSAPQTVFYPGDPTANPPTGEYAADGMLYHPDCTGTCASSYATYDDDQEYGVLYGVNIVQPWIDEVGNDVDLIWNVSTWNPYGVVLMRTRIEE